MKHIPSGKYCSVKEFAKKNNLTLSGVYAAIKQGRLTGAYKIDKTYLIRADAVVTISRNRDGRFIGISDLERGDMQAFLKKRGYVIEE